MSQPNSLPEKSESHPGVVARWSPTGIGTSFVLETSLPVKTPEERGRVLAIIEGDSVAGETLLGQQLAIRDYICHPVDITDDESGEVVQAVRTLLIEPSGRVVTFVSAGVLKSLGRLAYVRDGFPPWEPPIVVTLRQRSTGRGRRTYSLSPVES